MQLSNAGSYILIIKDEPYKAAYPEEKRLVNRTIDTNLEIKERWYTVNDRNIPEVNILWYVKGITSEAVSGLDTREQILILKDYLLGQKTLNAIKNHQNNFVSQAIKDYDAAIGYIFCDHPDYENSCRASSLFAREILRAKLQAEGSSFEDAQTIIDLAGRLDADLKEEIKEIIPWIQKRTEDGESTSPATLEDAVNGVRSSLALFSKLFPEKINKKAHYRGRPLAP